MTSIQLAFIQKLKPQTRSSLVNPAHEDNLHKSPVCQQQAAMITQRCPLREGGGS